ncbi:MAG: class I SAM-dependent methyltransferase [Prevotellaceae bacterium]|jgi:2-polyprenyl-3-methyl-5-hydroxy-6-metoxy-1,4-benzoquinol methylase|nr:class I SAM-dependent methyltransferase [Prevotellaceae bacterium]
MTEICLTDRAFWERYWTNYQYEKIPSKIIYSSYIRHFQNKKSFIEIGGFPGINAAYFYKNVCKDVTLLDFYIDKKIVNNLETYNQIPVNTIQCIESDFLKFENDRYYDIVLSVGFIEHFKNTKDIIECHVKLLSDKGSLLIILPNFRGINGFLQYISDRKHFKAHNLNSMKIKNLKQIMYELKFDNAQISYTRKPMLWLEPKPTKANKIERKIIKVFSYALKLFPIKCRLLSPYIIIFAKKQ